MTEVPITFTALESDRAYTRRCADNQYDSQYYGKKIYQEPEAVITRFVEYMARDTAANDHDTIIGTGVSGSLAAALLAVATGRMYAVLRKDGAHNHSSRRLEGQVGRRWIFVDDFVSGGGTRQRVRDFMTSKFGDEVTYVGDWVYDTTAMGPWVPAPKPEPKLDLGSEEPRLRVVSNDASYITVDKRREWEETRLTIRKMMVAHPLPSLRPEPVIDLESLPADKFTRMNARASDAAWCAPPQPVDIDWTWSEASEALVTRYYETMKTMKESLSEPDKKDDENL